MPVSVLAREKILSALKSEPFLTTAQVARLFYSTKRDGTPAKATRIKPRNKEYLLEPGYFSARDILDNMAEGKGSLINKYQVPSATGKTLILWMLPGQKPPSKWNIDHETECADLFVSYERTGKLENWDPAWTAEEYRAIFKKYGIKYDRRMELEDIDRVYFWEHDRGTETRQTLATKCEKYMLLAKAYPEDNFSVLFTVLGSKWANQRARVEWLLESFKGFRCGNLFLATPYEVAKHDPLGASFISPLDPDGTVSLLDL